MLLTTQNFRKAAVTASLLVAAATSHASLVYVGPAPASGTGIGTVSTILTIQSPANSTTETGGVSFTGSGDTTSGTGVKPGASQTSTYSLGEIGATNASQLGIIFNAVEPGQQAGGENGITLDNLVLTIYSSSGAMLFNSGAFTPRTFDMTFNGAGQSGYLFKLDTAQAAAAQAAAFVGNFQTNRVGLLASASNASGGFETFYLQADAATTPGTGGGGGGNGGPGSGGGAGNAVPEPGPLALLGIGLISLLAFRRSNAG